MANAVWRHNAPIKSPKRGGHHFTCHMNRASQTCWNEEFNYTRLARASHVWEREIHARVVLTDARIVGIRGNAVVGLERNILIATMALGAFKYKLTELNWNGSSRRSSLERDLIISEWSDWAHNLKIRDVVIWYFSFRFRTFQHALKR